MTKIQRSALIPYSIDKIYRLINDIEAYPEFLDGCIGSELISQGDEYMEARLDLAKAGLRYSFTTRNQLDAPSRIIMSLVDGPFSSFEGEWLLQPLSDDACKISLQLSFELRAKIVGLAAKTLFEPMANNLVDAIVQRARQIHS